MSTPRATYPIGGTRHSVLASLGEVIEFDDKGEQLFQVSLHIVELSTPRSEEELEVRFEGQRLGRVSIGDEDRFRRIRDRVVQATELGRAVTASAFLLRGERRVYGARVILDEVVSA